MKMKPMIKYCGSLLSVWVLSAICLTGCSTTSPISAGTLIGCPDGEIWKLRENNPLLGKYLSVGDVHQARVNGLRKVEVVAGNVSDSVLQFEYRFRWLDENKMEIKSSTLSGWNSVSSNARDQFTMTGVAPSEKAQGWLFMVRFPNRY